MGAMKVWDGSAWQTVAPFSERASVYVGPDAPAGTAYAGDLWWDTDDPAPSMPGQELAYAQITTDFPFTATSAATAQQAITTGAVTYDGSPILIDFCTPGFLLTPTAVGQQALINLWDGNTDLGFFAHLIVPANASIILPTRVARRLTPTAGSHTYNVRGWISGGTTGRISAGPPYLPAFLRVTRV